MRAAGGFHLEGADQTQGFVIGRPGEGDRIGAPLAFDGHGDLVIMDTVEFPVMGFSDMFDQIDRMQIIGFKVMFGQCHMLGLTVLARGL